MHPDNRGGTFWLKSVSGHVQCRLKAHYASSSSLWALLLNRIKYQIVIHFTAPLPGLINGDVNFNVSCFVHNHGLCFPQFRCPTVFASSGHRALLTFGLQDTLCFKAIKMSNTGSRFSAREFLHLQNSQRRVKTASITTTSL